MFDNILDARDALHTQHAGQYVAREDGAVVAYMSREGQSWRPISKVPPEIKALLVRPTEVASAQ